MFFLWITMASMAHADYSKLIFPSTSPQSFESRVIGVDHRKEPSFLPLICENFEGKMFPHCYAGHDGTDYILAGGFDAMDKGVPVNAAAAGTVVEALDGFYDRCRAIYFPYWIIFCDWHIASDNENANMVLIKQDDGLFAAYYHLKKGSVAVKESQRVEAGAHLGDVGSSGLSSGPHLHFELRKIRDGFTSAHPRYREIAPHTEIIDPYSEKLWR